jgi:hypothetical protein
MAQPDLEFAQSTPSAPEAPEAASEASLPDAAAGTQVELARLDRVSLGCRGNDFYGSGPGSGEDAILSDESGVQLALGTGVPSAGGVVSGLPMSLVWPMAALKTYYPPSCTGVQKTWKYQLTVTQKTPSRMAVVKNALGNTVNITTSWLAPPEWNARYNSGTWDTTHAQPWSTYMGSWWQVGVTPYLTKVQLTVTVSASGTAPNVVITKKYLWTATYSVNTMDPGIPFTAYDAAGLPTVGTGGAYTPARKLVDKTSGLVNWGLVVYSDAAIAPFTKPMAACAGGGTATLLVLPDVQDTGDAKALDAYLNLSTVSTTVNGKTIKGIGANGATPTRAALQFASKVFLAQANGGSVTDAQGTLFAITADPKLDCSRTYASILVTDGLSNTCNPVAATNANNTTGGNWIWHCCNGDVQWFVTSPCPATCASASCCDPAGSSGYSCLDQVNNHYADFPAGAAENNWETPLGSSRLQPIRTWVIGLSEDVNRCELNFTAYMGHTDAKAPKGDAGFDFVADTDTYHLLPSPAPTSIAELPLAGKGMTTNLYNHYNATTGVWDHDWAYFAKNVDDLQDAFAAIVAGAATGDYATSAPVATNSSSSTATLGLLATSEFPTWKGHLYAYNVSNPVDPATCNYTMEWDAGENLTISTFPADYGQPNSINPFGNKAKANKPNPGYVAPGSRSIWTWDSTKALIEVTEANVVALQGIAAAYGPSGFVGTTLTTNVVKFIKGLDPATGTSRAWILGPNINSTPAIIQAPYEFTQGTISAGHAAFETAYKNRTPVIWVGTNDGMLHAFKVGDGLPTGDGGKEIKAILPPNLLWKQVELYGNYALNPADNPVGQPKLPDSQVYGVANSPRYADVYLGSPIKEYRTVMIVTEGPGGDMMAGLDVTDIENEWPAKILWEKKGALSASPTMNNYYYSWSTPALAAMDSTGIWKLVTGGGWNPSGIVTGTTTPYGQKVPYTFSFNPADGTSVNSITNPLDTQFTYPPFVGSQTFADSVLFSTTATAYYPDNLANLGLQADLNGRIWFVPGANFDSATVGIDASKKAGQPQPIYYPPAVSGFETTAGKFDLFAFASGTFYEQAPAITGANVGKDYTGAGQPYFIPSLYLVAKDQKTNNAASTSQILQLKIRDFDQPPAQPCSDPADSCDPAGCCPVGTTCTSAGKVGPRTQVTAPPALFVPIGGIGDPTAIFLLYDPDTADCGGTSYIVKIAFNVGSDGNPATKKITMYKAGEGAGSGFAIAGTSVMVGRSGVGSGAKGTLSKVPGLNPTQGLSNPTPIWWRELK